MTAARHVSVREIFTRTAGNKKLILSGAGLLCVFCAVVASYAFAVQVNIAESGGSDVFPNFTFSMLIIYPLALYIAGLYKRGAGSLRLLTALLAAIGSSIPVFVFLIFGRITRLYLPEKQIVLAFYFLAAGSVLSVRSPAMYKIITLNNRSNNVVFIGADALTAHIIEIMQNTRYKPIGLLSGNDSIERIKDDLPVFGAEERLGAIIKSKKIKTLVVSMKDPLPRPLLKEIYKAKFKGIAVHRSDYFYEILTRKFAIEYYLSDKQAPCLDMDRFTRPVFKNTKKLLDFFGSLTGLILLSPLFLLISVLIKLTSKGPIFYLQERIGLREKPFKLIKFRTMIHEAEKDTGPKWATENDSRTTTVGNFLRNTKLDELPQLINILAGKLSFVGPRPIREHFAKIIEKEIPFYSIRFSVRPGITGWAQVNYDYGGTVEGHIEKFQYDLYYLKHASLLLDLFIIFKTVRVLWAGPGIIDKQKIR